MVWHSVSYLCFIELAETKSTILQIVIFFSYYHYRQLWIKLNYTITREARRVNFEFVFWVTSLLLVNEDYINGVKDQTKARHKSVHSYFWLICSKIQVLNIHFFFVYSALWIPIVQWTTFCTLSIAITINILSHFPSFLVQNFNFQNFLQKCVIHEIQNFKKGWMICDISYKKSSRFWPFLNINWHISKLIMQISGHS